MSAKTRSQKIVEEMINSISKEKTLRQVLGANNIADIETIHEINPYKRDGNRSGLILDVQEKNSDARSKIMIDLKQGQPVINQVFDSLYDIGKDCSKRIIMYSDGHNKLDKGVPAADYWVVNCLINNLQQYPLGIHFYKMDEETFTIGPHYMHDQEKPAKELPISKVPTREQFMAETFWVVYFDSFNEEFYRSNKTFSDRFRDTGDWGYIIYIDCSFFGEIQLYWDKNGVRYEVKQEDDSEEYLKMVLDFEMPELHERYGSGAVEFENVVGKLPRLHIKYSDKPFDWLYTSRPKQITEFAKTMYDDAWCLRWRIEERIDGIIKGESA
jgi:hypothetical protein